MKPRKNLSRFLEHHFAARKHGPWYLFPRALYPSEKTLDDFHKVLSRIAAMQFVAVKDIPNYQPKLGERFDSETRVLRKWSQKDWQAVYRVMVEKKIIQPVRGKKQSWNDRLANVRNYRNLFTKFGFGFINTEKHFFLSDAGNQFLQSDATQWSNIIEQQFCRLQFWNPSLDKKEWGKYLKFKVFPYLAAVEIVARLRECKLTRDEFVLFVAPMKEMKQILKITECIEEYRVLDEKTRKKIVKAAKFTYPETANAAVHLQWFGLTRTFSFKEKTLFAKDLPQGKHLARNYRNTLRFVNYAQFEDWYAFIGRNAPEFTAFDVASYYAQIGETQKAKEILEEYHNDLPENLSEEEAWQRLIQEKQLEDYLESRLSQIDKDLVLVKRQYATEIGRIDLLAKSKSTGELVVIELKRGRASDKVMGQCLRYMGWVHLHLAKGRLVKGIIVGDIRPEFELALIGMKHPIKDVVTLKQFDIKISASIT